MSFTVKKKHHNRILDDHWYDIDVHSNELLRWILKQPQNAWYHIECINHTNTYIIHESLFNSIQLKWGDT